MRARLLGSFAAGLLFGLGLVVSRMFDPAKVLGFLDLAGNWDPSLALVMVGALALAAVGYRLANPRGAPFFDTRFHASAATRVDAKLVGGAAIFGIGWGLVGYCPGPAVTALAFGRVETLVFVAAMIAGMVAHRLFASALLGTPAARTASN
jgi:uncharacterized membrane protein YedE/YeeE